MKRNLTACLVSCLFALNSFAEEYSCPPQNSLSSCVENAKAEEKSCINQMSDYLHDKDNLADKHYHFYMINIGCHEKYLDNTSSCKETCT